MFNVHIKRKKRGKEETSRAMDKFRELHMVIISWVYTYLQTP